MSKYYTDPATGAKVTIKKTHKFRNFVVLPAIAIIAVVIGVQAASGGGGGTASNPGNNVGGPAAGTAVVYKVAGSGTGMVTYSTQDLQVSQETSAALPWTKTVQFPDGTFLEPLTLTATNGMNTSGDISCTILKDGKVVAENTSSGQFASVTCNG